MPTKVLMPQMGEAVIEATITTWLKKEGDTIAEYDALVEVNTDKVDSEVPSPVSGTILKILYAEGDTVAVDSIMAWIGEPGETIPADGGADAPPKAVAHKPAAAQPALKPTPPPAQPTPARTLTPPPASAPAVNGHRLGVISPLVAKIAAARGVDLARVHGTGPAGRVTKQDVLAHTQGHAAQPAAAAMPVASGPRSTFISPVVARLVGQHNINIAYVTGTGKDGRVTKNDIEAYVAAGKPVPAATPPAAFSAAPSVAPAPPVVSTVQPGSLIKFTPVRKSIAKHMVHSKHTSPHVTTIMEVDMSRVWAHRAANKAAFTQSGVNLTFTVYFMAATTTALQAYPIVNSSWTDEGIAVHQDINIGMATSLGEAGLIVPVLKGMAGLSLFEIAFAVNDLAERARSKKLVPDEVQGGTFTITNHGTSGSLFASPIINQPQAAILGTGMIQKRAVVINDAIAIRPMVYLGLTIDHRILDGAIADYFLGHIKHSLESWA